MDDLRRLNSIEAIADVLHRSDEGSGFTRAGS